MSGMGTTKGSRRARRQFSEEFKVTMTSVMVIDYVACYAIEIVLKFLFSDLKARDIAERRPEQLERERVRKEEERKVKAAEEEKKEAERIAEFERQLEEKKRQLTAAWSGAAAGNANANAVRN